MRLPYSHAFYSLQAIRRGVKPTWVLTEDGFYMATAVSTGENPQILREKYADLHYLGKCLPESLLTVTFDDLQ